MATKKLKGLGRGLDALLGGDDKAPDANTPSELPVTQMQAGKYQPRTRMDEGALNEPVSYTHLTLPTIYSV